MQIIERNIADLIRAEYNPRELTDDQEKQLSDSLRRFGVVDPVIVNVHEDRKDIIIGGHQRSKVWQKLGNDTIPTVELSLTLDQEKELNVRLNKNTGQFDMEMLKDHFETDDLIDWGFTDVELEWQEDVTHLEAEEDDFEVPEEVHTDIVQGDLIEIGPHRLLCGDSTNSDDVERLMDGQKADLAHNDPPYGMKKEGEGVANDNLNFQDLLEFNREWIPLQFKHLKENSSWYCWGIDEPLMDIYSNILKPYMIEGVAYFRNLITWNKGNGQGQMSEDFRSYANADEKCLFIMFGMDSMSTTVENFHEGFSEIRDWLIQEKEKSGLKNNEIREITNTSHSHYWSKSQWAFPTKEHYEAIQKSSNGKAFNKSYKEIKQQFEKVKKEFYKSRAYFNNTHDNMNNVWNISRTSTSERELTGKHATPKPLELCERVIKTSCPERGISLDFFLGSGSTMVASHQLNRKCYGIELQPHYCQVIVDRMMKLDSSLSVKINGKDYGQE